MNKEIKTKVILEKFDDAGKAKSCVKDDWFLIETGCTPEIKKFYKKIGRRRSRINADKIIENAKKENEE